MLALRATRSLLYRLMFIALRWSTPALLIFGDTVFVYNFVAANFSLLLALHRRIYASTSWPSMLRRLEHTAMLFNLNCVGLAEHEARDLTKRLEQPPDGGLADAASDAVASEPRQVTWRRFAQAWNSVVLALRRGDLVSDAERDALCFHALSGADAADFLGIREDEVYVIFPTMLSSPCFSSVGLRHAASSSYPSVARSLLQMRDLFGWCRLRHSLQFSSTPL